MERTRIVGYVCFAAFLACLPLANWMILHVGTVCLPQGFCLLPVAPGLLAPSGVAAIGFALVLRDIVQRCLGTRAGLLAVFAGSLAASTFADPRLAAAAGGACLLSQLADFAIYTPLQRGGLMRAVLVSSAVGLVIDSVVFLWMAFGSLDFLAGQIVGKSWAVLISIPLIHLARRLAPAPA